MRLTAKLIQILHIQTGTGKNGDWKKQDVILETSLLFSEKICVSFWGDKVNTDLLEIGKRLRLTSKMEAIGLQTQFAQIVQKTEALKTEYQRSLHELENLYASLSQKAFRGELSLTEEMVKMDIKELLQDSLQLDFFSVYGV